MAIAVILLAVAAPSAASSPSAQVIACLGDSITVGITHHADRDPLGGYPGRLQRRLGPRVHILNRGLSGTTTA
ncbi:MAG TPA: SGNH/GDSL hydrolase family protein, partial [Candidatus Binatus sp.]|nr:SGNH/GDSL hydrolase family protein [Candidatus Binatus sp.]